MPAAKAFDSEIAVDWRDLNRAIEDAGGAGTAIWHASEREYASGIMRLHRRFTSIVCCAVRCEMIEYGQAYGESKLPRSEISGIARDKTARSGSRWGGHQQGAGLIRLISVGRASGPWKPIVDRYNGHDRQLAPGLAAGD